MLCEVAVRRLLAGAALAGSLLALAGCGGQRSTLPPPPSGASGFVPLVRLTRYPEVYVGASVTTLGTVARTARGVYELTGPGARRPVEIYPRSLAARWRGQRVYASGVLSVTFETGYQLSLTGIASARS